MVRSSLIVGLALLSACTFKQAPAQEAPAQTLVATDDAALTSAPTPAREKGPVGAINLGYIYVASETAPGTWNWHLHGFFGIAQVNFKPWLGVIADFTQDYNTSAGAHENVQSILAGPIVTYKAKAKISPFAFADAGRVRDSKSGTIGDSAAFALGGGFTYKLSKHLAVLVVPGEYLRNYPPTGPYSSQNNFTARAGISIPLMR